MTFFQGVRAASSGVSMGEQGWGNQSYGGLQYRTPRHVSKNLIMGEMPGASSLSLSIDHRDRCGSGAKSLMRRRINGTPGPPGVVPRPGTAWRMGESRR